MNKKTSVVWLAAGIVSVLALATPNLAQANHYLRHQRHEKARRQAALSRDWWGDRTELRHDLRRDVGELYRDRAELRHDLRRGASADEIARDRAEIRRDLDDIAQDRKRIRDHYASPRRDSDQYDWRGYPYGRYSGYGYPGNRYGWGNYERYGWLNRDRYDRWDPGWGD